MIKKVNSNVARLARHARVRKKVSGTAECPRLCVCKSGWRSDCQEGSRKRYYRGRI